MINTGVCRYSHARSAVLITAAMLISPWVFAADTTPLPESQATLAVAITIDAENLLELYQSIPGIKIIDTRFHEDYVLGHIETSRNIPLSQIDCKTLSKLAKSAEQAMVFYCNGNAGDTSIEAIQIASGCGYKRLFWLRGGFIEWKDKDYPYVIE